MRSSRTIRALGAAALATSGVLLATGAVAGASAHRFEHRSPHALFVETDQTRNTVISYVPRPARTPRAAPVASRRARPRTPSRARADSRSSTTRSN